MRLETFDGAPERLDVPLLAVLVLSNRPFSDLEGLGDLTRGALFRAMAAGDFKGRAGDRLLAYGASDGGPRRVLFLGVGPSETLRMEGVREAAGEAVRAAEAAGAESLGLSLHGLGAEPGERFRPCLGQAAAEGLVLASWRFDELRSRPLEFDGDPPAAPTGVESAVIAAQPDDELAEAIAVGRALADGENLARTLQARPGNVATPSHLAAQAERIAEEEGLEAEVLGPAEMEAQGMGALLAVAKGSDQEPRLIVLRHRGGQRGAAPLVLMGKGLTFDAGGISIKPAKGMEDMKYDMSGGAAVLGAMMAIGRLGVPINVTGVVPSSENLLNGSATRPGDVVHTRAGKTVEVINTDAEGRLILADALDYACGWEPAAIVDCATLTGACVIALGHHRSALLGNDEDLMHELRRAGRGAGQPCWQLPLDDDYRKQLKSEVADLKNVGGRPAGTITAACFLSEFVGSTPWAHLDIAGTAYGKSRRSYLRNGPAGTPCRLLVEWVRERAVVY